MQTHAVEAVSADAVSLVALANGLLSHPNCNLLMPSLMPTMAMFVIESRKTLRVLDPIMAATLEDEFVSQLAPARRRAKLLDDNRMTIDEAARELASIAQNQTDFFLSGHTGPLSSLTRALQPDLGLTTYDGHIISSTHFTAAIVSWHSGTDPKVLGDRIRLATFEFAVYGLHLLLNLGLRVPEPADVSVLDGAIMTRDANSPDLYRRGLLGQLPHELAIGAAGTLVSLNYLKYIILPVLAARGLSALRLKIITAYHASSYLTYLQRYLYGVRGQTEEAALLAVACGTPESRWLRKKRGLRNVSVHYLSSHDLLPVVRGSSRDEILIRLGDKTVEAMHISLDRHLDTMSRVLEEGFDLLTTPLPGVPTD